MRLYFQRNNKKKPKDRKAQATLEQQLNGRSLVLIGLMGAGKSSVGRRLANQLSLPFVDSDDEIEAAAGNSISDIFEQYGEAYFRDREQKVIHRLLKNGSQVLATGGGAFLNQATQKSIRKRGISIWLKADLDVLLERVTRRDHRPLLQNNDPKDVLSKLIKTRYPIYEKADLHIESRDVPHQDIIEDIVKALTNHLSNES